MKPARMDAMARLTLRAGGYQPESSVHTRGMRRFAEDLARRTGGDIAVAVEADVTRQGKRAADLLTLVENGGLDLCYFSSSYIAGRVPSLLAIDLPFGVSDRGAAFARLDGTLGARLAEETAARTGYRILGYWDNGFRHLSNRQRPIRRPADCKGLRLRTLDSRLHQRVFTALGFKPLVIDVKDLVAAVESHTVDAQENPLTNLVNFGLQHTHRHVSLTAHVFGVALLLVNRGWFDALPADMRGALVAAAAEASAAQRTLAEAEDARCLDLLLREGVSIVPAEDIDRDAFRAAVAQVVDEEFGALDPALRDAFAV